MDRYRSRSRRTPGSWALRAAVLAFAMLVPGLALGAGGRPAPSTPVTTPSTLSYTAAGVAVTVTKNSAAKRYVSLTLKPSKCVRRSQKVTLPRKLQVGRTGSFSYRGRVGRHAGGSATISGRVLSSTKVKVNASYRAKGCAWHLNTTASRHSAPVTPGPAAPANRPSPG